MKAVILTEYGSPDGFQLQEVAKPAIKDKEILIRVRIATVTAGDCELRTLKFPIWLALPLRLWLGFSKPRRNILGQEIAGEVEAVGEAVRRFKVGDAVFGSTGFSFGAYAEYAALSESNPLAIKPAAISFEEAAAIPVGGLEALHFLRQANIQPGEKVLIVGAGGSIGTFALQLAHHFGAGDITAVDSGEKLDMLRSIGAAHVIDYKREDFTRNGETYDIIFDVPGKSSVSRNLKSLKPNGRYLLSNPDFSNMVRGTRTVGTSGQKIIARPVDQKAEDLVFLAELIADGKIKVVIDQRYPLEQLADAHRYVEGGHKKGSVVITV